MSKRYSLEFFPPKTAVGRDKLREVRATLNTLGPDFFSMTYGAGGSTRDNTRDIVLEMKQEGLPVAPHLSFGGDSEESILALVMDYRAAGVDRIVALRGDTPSGVGVQRPVYAEQLVRFIREHTGNHFQLEVAAYPEIHPDAPSYDADIGYLKAKLDAGANSAITQYFYNVDGYFHFLDQCRRAGIDQPIYPGVMPITNYQNLARFSRACGAEIPRWLARRLESYGDDTDAITAFGLDVVTRLCERLLEGGAPGLHFYTMNQVEPTQALWNRLGLPRPKLTAAN